MKHISMKVLLVFTVIFFIHVPGNSIGAEKNDNITRGKRLYGQYCSPCHGLKGNGRGPRAKNELLQPPPRDHTNGFYINMIPDVRLFKVIKYGGKMNNLSHIMPQWRHILSDEEVLQIVAYIRSLADPPYEPPASTNWDKDPYAVGNQQENDLPYPVVLDLEGNIADLYEVHGFPTGF